MTKSRKRKLTVNSRIWNRSLKHLPDSNDTTVFKNILEFIQISIKDCCIYFVFGVISTNQDCIDIRSSYKTKNKKNILFTGTVDTQSQPKAEIRWWLIRVGPRGVSINMYLASKYILQHVVKAINFIEPDRTEGAYKYRYKSKGVSLFWTKILI